MNKLVRVNGNEIKLTNLDKLIWPDERYTKADLIMYYSDISRYLLPHIENRLFVMNRFPDGINNESFYQKNCPDYAPEWVDTFSVRTRSKAEKIDYVVCNNLETLIWLANQACIEMHPWLAKTTNLECPDIAVFDLDPMPPLGFESVIEIALMVKEALLEFGLESYPKTSGSSGMHVYVPLKPLYTYRQVKDFVHFVCRIINRVYPERTTLERLADKRGGRVYLDYLQNTRGKTMACQYSLRPNPGAPVSVPLTWNEVSKGKINPFEFNIKTVLKRVNEIGDLFKEILSKRQMLDNTLEIVNEST